MVEVTQADRKAAASVAVLAEMRELILAGRADHHAEPWAAHRIAALEEAAKVADELGGVRPKTADQEPFRAQHTRANTIATAIRAILEKNNERG